MVKFSKSRGFDKLSLVVLSIFASFFCLFASVFFTLGGTVGSRVVGEDPLTGLIALLGFIVFLIGGIWGLVDLVRHWELYIEEV